MHENKKREKYCSILGSQSPNSTREIAGVKYQRLDRDFSGLKHLSLPVPPSLGQPADLVALKEYNGSWFI